MSESLGFWERLTEEQLSTHLLRQYDVSERPAGRVVGVEHDGVDREDRFLRDSRSENSLVLSRLFVGLSGRAPEKHQELSVEEPHLFGTELLRLSGVDVLDGQGSPAFIKRGQLSTHPPFLEQHRGRRNPRWPYNFVLFSSGYFGGFSNSTCVAILVRGVFHSLLPG